MRAAALLLLSFATAIGSLNIWASNRGGLFNLYTKNYNFCDNTVIISL